ncbi:MAG TPA: NADP-dependent phosphogluconate dehydrogenase [Fimbriimonadaceae bacterium]|nr:NADP-dependent phosphogluconate dehydrogenase [Fimbriimonadaceae bacterium]
MAETYQFGLVGLGTMGRNLALNVSDHEFSVIGLATSEEKAANFSKLGEGRKLTGVCGPESFIAALEKPRIVMMLVPAGDPVDAVIAELSQYMEPGDFFIDGGNSHFTDTDRRYSQLLSKGIGFIGIGVSGGEEGARHGPSMMAGGPPENYERVRSILEAVSAKYQGDPCVALLGKGAAGHYVKMVHNGIEYALMQLIAEAYDLMKRVGGLGNGDIADRFLEWTDGPFGGFLTQITSDVLRIRDEGSGKDLVDLVLDKAKQKGTGKWTSQDALDLGVPIPTIDTAVSARQLSGLKEERTIAAQKVPMIETEKKLRVAEMGDALHLAFLIAYCQGISLLSAASEEHGMDIDLEGSARVWRAGCIIRSKLLEPLRVAITQSKGGSLLFQEPFLKDVRALMAALRHVCIAAMEAEVPAPCFYSALAYLDGYRTARLPANLIQAQRDYFGAHTYERVDQEGSFHSDWGPN